MAFYLFVANQWAPGMYLREGPEPFLHEAVAVDGDGELPVRLVAAGLGVVVDLGDPDPARRQESGDLWLHDAPVQGPLAQGVGAHDDGVPRLYPGEGRTQHREHILAVEFIVALAEAQNRTGCAGPALHSASGAALSHALCTLPPHGFWTIPLSPLRQRACTYRGPAGFASFSILLPQNLAIKSGIRHNLPSAVFSCSVPAVPLSAVRGRSFRNLSTVVCIYPR